MGLPPAVAPVVSHCPFAPLSDAELLALGAGDAVIRDNTFPEPFIRAAREEMVQLHAQGVLTPAHLGRERLSRPEIRGDETAWLSEAASGPALKSLWPYFAGICEEVNQAAWLGLQRWEVQVARYGPGTRYRRHLDTFATRSARRLTVILYLNADWCPAHAGSLRIYPENSEPVDLAPIGGRLVLFRSEKLSHEVCTTAAERYTVTAWFHGREDVPFLSDPTPLV